jgi:chromosome segregation protein
MARSWKDLFVTGEPATADRAQFIVVTHQKRTMDAADTLYGVSMGADGVSRVVSRKLSGRPAADEAEAA